MGRYATQHRSNNIERYNFFSFPNSNFLVHHFILVAEFNIGAFVEPMIWEYRRGETFSLGPGKVLSIRCSLAGFFNWKTVSFADLWDKYSYIFPRIWIASAFKGAVGSCQISSVVGHYLSNHEKWLTVVAELRDRFIVRGITFTGWSR